MKINKENIEYFIFDYHEGNLSDSDKAEVLNFIHQHPEYENDFAHWAQSYCHAEDPVKNYGIAEKLLQPDVMPWYTKKWVLSGGTIAVVAMGLYSYLALTKPETQITPQELMPAVVTEKQIERIEKGKSSGIDIDYRSAETNQKTTPTSNEKSLTPATSVSVFTPSITDTLVDTHMNTPANNPVQTNTVTKVDTVQKNIAIQENNPVKAKKASQKHKSSLRLKAENKFIPTNPDF